MSMSHNDRLSVRYNDRRGSGTGSAGQRAGRMRRLHRPRRAAVLVAALVCIAVASAVFVSILRTGYSQRQRARLALWQIQARWLAQSGLERARATLAERPDYAGETWRLPAQQLGGQDAGVVRIEVQALPGEPKQRLISVQADYPDHSQHRARESRQWVVDLP